MRNLVCNLLASAALVLGIWEPAAAVLLKVTQITSEEMVFNEPTDTLTPSTLNNVLSFTVERTDASGPATTISTASYFGLKPATVDTPYPIQHKGALDKLFANDADYLSAGTQGLSLSTGINKITDQSSEQWFFPVIYINPTAVNDGVADFLVTDIANNQSPDLWELLDDVGNVIASITTEGPKTSGNDWNRVGTQNLNRWRNSDSTLLRFDNRHLSAMALELSDFSGLSPANASHVASMRVSIANPLDDPRTDYAFISSDTNAIRFSNQVQPPSSFNPENFVSTPTTLTLVGLVLPALVRLRRHSFADSGRLKRTTSV